MPPPARITGRVRGRPGYAVDLYLGRKRVGRTSPVDGSFEFEPPSAGASAVHIRVVDEGGSPVLQTRPVRFHRAVADYQVQLAVPEKASQGPDIYADNLKRLLRAYRGLRKRLDPADKDALEGLDRLVRLIGRWDADRRRLQRAGAAEVVQVPKHPARTAHRHVSTWDQVVLPP